MYVLIFKTSRPTTKATDKWYCAKPGWSALNKCWNSMNLLIFPMVDIFSLRHYWPPIKTRLLKFPSPYRNDLQGCIFMKEINHLLLVFFLITFIFSKKMYSRNDETVVLEVPEIIFFSLPNHSGQTFAKCFQNSIRGFYNSVVAYL